jgi:hypothetical protein
MRVWLSGADSIHAPAQSAAALISSHTSGGDGAVLIVHPTFDRKIVCCPTDDLAHLTGHPGRLHEFEYRVLRRANIGATFKNIDGVPVRHNAQPQLLSILIEDLPADMDVVLDLTRAVTTARQAYVQAVLTTVAQSRVRKNYIYLIQDIADVATIRDITLQAILILCDRDTEAMIDRAIAHALAGAMLPRQDYIRFAPKIAGAPLALGAVVKADDGILDAQKFAELSAQPSVYAATTRSVLMSEQFHFRKRLLCDEDFAGREVDTDNWSLGYARANSYCHVYQDNGVHIDIAPYNPPPLPPPPNDIERRLRRLEIQVLVALEDTPTYSGGGVGVRRGLEGDFSVEALLSSQQAVQASTVEIAVINGDPGRHFEPWNPDGTRFPQGAHDKHAFFDPHGARPYVGTEHD